MYDIKTTSPTWLEQFFAWLLSRERAVLLGAVAFHLLVLAGMIVLRAMPLYFGTTVLIRTAPVDPRDVFRGDYVVLRYEFSRVPPDSIDGLDSNVYVYNSDKWEGRPVYARLVKEPDGKHWQVDKVSITPPVDGLYLHGKIDSWGSLVFGIEAYYVQEGTGHKYEEAIRDGNLSAEISVMSNGKAALRSLKIE